MPRHLTRPKMNHVFFTVLLNVPEKSLSFMSRSGLFPVLLVPHTRKVGLLHCSLSFPQLSIKKRVAVSPLSQQGGICESPLPVPVCFPTSKPSNLEIYLALQKFSASQCVYSNCTAPAMTGHTNIVAHSNQPSF